MTYRLKDFQEALLEVYNQNPEAQYRTRISGPGMQDHLIPGVTLPPSLPAGVYEVQTESVDNKGNAVAVFSGTVDVPQSSLMRKREARNAAKGGSSLDLATVFEKLEEKRQEVDRELKELRDLRTTTERSFLKELADENDRRWQRRFEEEREHWERKQQELSASHERELEQREKLHKLELELRGKYEAKAPNVERERIKQETVVKVLEFAEPLKAPAINLANELLSFGLSKLLKTGAPSAPVTPETP
jgi:hypothetical protein